MSLLTRRMQFSASHRTWRPGWSEERNRATFGPLRGGGEVGHNYELEVTLRGAIDEETGMVMDLKRLKDLMEDEVGARFDHRHLDHDTPFFRDVAATPENVATVIFELLDAAVPDGRLERVRLRPSSDLWVEVTR